MNRNTKPKIAVVGAGAVGSVLGGLLVCVGEDVTLIARRAHVEAINRNGLFIDGVSGKLTVNVKAAERLDFRPDLVLLTVKTQDVDATCQAIKSYVQDIPIVLLQNGVRSDEIAASTLGKEYLISGIVCFNARFVKPGNVTHGSEGVLLVGEAFGENGKRVKEIGAILRKAVKTIICDNIHGAHWTKLLMNVMGNSLDAMSGLSLGECMRHSGLRRIGILILREALDVVEKAGIQLKGIPEFPIFAFKIVIKSPLFLASGILGLLMRSKRYEDIITSTLQSIRRGKPTEIDYLNGEIVKLGKKIGVLTPYNSKVVELVHTVEETHEFYSPDVLESLFSLGAPISRGNSMNWR
jgi:2-dehydropantoate 2-reductase